MYRGLAVDRKGEPIMSRASRYTIITAALIAVSPASAHHSDAGINMESVIAFEGTVTEFAWRNPHVYALVQVTGDGGEAVEWDLQMGPTNVLFRRGWRRDTLQPGDLVAVRAHAAVSGRAYGIIESIDKDGGLGLVAASGAPQTPATTTTISGKWIADRSATMSYPGGFDGFFHALLTPNDKGTTTRNKKIRETTTTREEKKHGKRLLHEIKKHGKR